MGKWALTVLLGIVLCGPVACRSQDTAPVRANPGAASAGAGGVSQDYLIGPGDVIQVFVWRNPDLSVTVPVRPDGRITTPLVEDMQAAGKTTATLARDIEAVLAEYVRTPQVNVIVTTPRSALSEVKIVGQVQNPGAVPYRNGLTVLDAVLAAGGLTEFAAGNRAKIVRNENGRPREIKVKLKDVLERGRMSSNLPLQPGDVLIVPESLF